jgi:hypothetical protein
MFTGAGMTTGIILTENMSAGHTTTISNITTGNAIIAMVIGGDKKDPGNSGIFYYAKAKHLIILHIPVS